MLAHRNRAHWHYRHRLLTVASGSYPLRPPGALMPGASITATACPRLFVPLVEGTASSVQKTPSRALWRGPFEGKRKGCRGGPLILGCTLPADCPRHCRHHGGRGVAFGGRRARAAQSARHMLERGGLLHEQARGTSGALRQ